MNKDLILEVERIHELMLINSGYRNNEKKLIVESNPVLKLFLSKAVQTVDELAEWSRSLFKDGKIPENLSGKSIDDLTDDELKLLFKSMNPREAAKFLLEIGYISKKALNDAFEKLNESLEKASTEERKEILQKWIQGQVDASKTGWGQHKKDQVTDEFLDVYYEMSIQIINDAKLYLQKKSPKTFDTIKDNFIDLVKNIPRNIIEFQVQHWITRDFWYIQKILRGVFTSQARLEELFEQDLKQLEKRIKNGQTTDAEVAKAFSRIATMGRKWSASFENMKKSFLDSVKDPSLTKTLKNDEFFKELTNIKEPKSFGGELIDSLNKWRGLFPGKKNTVIFLQRIWNLVLRGTPSTFRETRNALASKGVYKGAFNYALSIANWNFFVLPTIITTFKVSGQYIYEFFASINNPNFESVVSPYEGKSDAPWGAYFLDSWKEYISESWTDASLIDINQNIPFTHLDEVYNLLKIVMKPKSIGLPDDISHWDGYIFWNESLLAWLNPFDNDKPTLFYYDESSPVQKNRQTGVWEVYSPQDQKWVILDKYCKMFDDVKCPCEENNTCP